MNHFPFLLALLITAPVASAIAVPSDAERLVPAWQALDANKDGAVAIDELHPLQAHVMKLHDADGGPRWGRAHGDPGIGSPARRFALCGDD